MREAGLDMGIRFVRRRSRLLVVTVLVTGAVALLAGSAWSAAPRPAPRPPTASTGGVSNVTYSSAILHGYVNPRGQVTNYVFQYGPTGAYGAQSPLAPAGNGTGSIGVSQAVTGLQPGIVYRYRIVASSPRRDGQGCGPRVSDAEGSAVGADRRHAQSGVVRRSVPRGGHAVGDGRIDARGRVAGQPVPVRGRLQDGRQPGGSPTAPGASRSRSRACSKTLSCAS